MIDGLDHFKILFVKDFAVEVNTALFLPLWLISIILILINFLFFFIFLIIENGGWGAWLEWSPCSKTCGEGGMKVRHRHCNSPVAKYGGAPCSRDDAMQTAPCDAGTYDKFCPRKFREYPLFNSTSFLNSTTLYNFIILYY